MSLTSMSKLHELELLRRERIRISAGGGTVDGVILKGHHHLFWRKYKEREVLKDKNTHKPLSH